MNMKTYENDKHTPAPWVDDLADHDAPCQHINIRAEKHRHPVCKIWIDDAPVHDFNAEQEANARLIKASPLLLTALRDLLEVHQHLGLYSDEQIKAAEQQATAALKTATPNA